MVLLISAISLHENCLTELIIASTLAIGRRAELVANVGSVLSRILTQRLITLVIQFKLEGGFHITERDNKNSIRRIQLTFRLNPTRLV